jgi:uracil phosphoribosyltransferase
MLPAFMRYLPQAKVGFVGQERDDETAIPSSYYAKFPSVHGKDLFVLEPMLATGGSAASTLETLLAEDAQPNSINLVSIIAAPQAIHRLHGFGQRLKISLLSVDQGLNEDNYIVPGLGDMGDLWVG